MGGNRKVVVRKKVNKVTAEKKAKGPSSTERASARQAAAVAEKKVAAKKPQAKAAKKPSSGAAKKRKLAEATPVEAPAKNGAAPKKRVKRVQKPKQKKEEAEPRLLPVTLLSGFLGVGKTTLLKQILRNKMGMKVAVVVNDMGAVNLDADEIANTKLVQEKTEMVELHNGCICCTLRGDLLKTVKEMSESDANFDYLVIESTGIAEPLPVAQTFTMDVNELMQEHEHEKHAHEHTAADFEPLMKYARLDTCVTVIDTFNIVTLLSAVETEADRRKLIGPDAENDTGRSLADLLIDQIEFADVLLMNKIDLIPKKKREGVIKELKGLLTKLNPLAKVIIPEKAKFEDFDVAHVINTNLFDLGKAQTSAGWIAELDKPTHTPETEEYGISSFVFKETGRPFHPARLAAVLDSRENGVLAGVVRAKGRVWLANAHGYSIDMHVAGKQLALEPSEPWLAAVPQKVWHDEHYMEQDDRKNRGAWHEEFGDRESELVCIGVRINHEAATKSLQSALLTDEELAAGPYKWAELQDPFFEGNCAATLMDVDMEELLGADAAALLGEEDEEVEEGEEDEEFQCPI
eukprot:TRINITY_DN5222_c0_g1_i1.p1 TRINITY_DN5222_c0_g1~~TRINITY_DN5222_c0_g1_i1.p1  ORF type:complete len:576 (+),score=286.97 TRINITY_DN5222_c0_g1_i1:57-1784(+)